jgi:hypothetical protein
MARTTLDLDPSVLRELRQRSLREGKSMSAVASEALARVMAEPADEDPSRLTWATKRMGTPQVDLEDIEAIQAVLDDVAEALACPKSQPPSSRNGGTAGSWSQSPPGAPDPKSRVIVWAFPEWRPYPYARPAAAAASVISATVEFTPLPIT